MSRDRGKTPRQDVQEESEQAAEFSRQIGRHLFLLDQAVSPTPSLDWFRQLAERQCQRERRQLRRDLLLLWAIGCLLISALLYSLATDIRWFIAVQCLSVMIPLSWGLYRMTRRVMRIWMN